MIKAWFLVIGFLQAGAPTALATAEAAELAKLEQSWNEAHLRGDAETLDRLWADDLIVIVPRMRVLTRAAAVGMVRNGRMRFERYETSDLQIRVYGDVGVVTGRLQRSRRMNGQIIEDDWQFTKVYVRGVGRWRVVSFHASERPK